MKRITIYTDGACSGNPGPGGWGAILIFGAHQKELSGSEPNTTNNKMELSGVIHALSSLSQPCTVDLYTDSRYVVDSITKGWVKAWRANGWKKKDKTSAKNIELWEKLLKLLEIHSVTFHWVKGHSNNPFNTRCDELAVAARNALAECAPAERDDISCLAEWMVNESEYRCFYCQLGSCDQQVSGMTCQLGIEAFLKDKVSKIKERG